MTGWLRTILVLAALAAAAGLGFATTVPGPSHADAAPGDRFSAGRAMDQLAAIATRPHPTGTEAASEVRSQLVARLTELGFTVSVQDTTSVTARYAAHGYPVVGGHVRNVVARRAGTVGAPAVLLEAHYDSRELAPGASDDGFGTVVLLEAARALSVGAPLRHDVVLLFTEGEEQGLLGARAFVEDSPLARDVAVAINVEARGDRGVGVMFQTSDKASDLVETLARVAPRVSAASLTQEVYRRMPNDTDLTVWLESGHAGMNFANIDGFERYHQSTDTLANADPRTVQQIGDSALALVRALADRDPVLSPPVHDDVYFEAGPFFVRYDARAALPLGLLALAAMVAATIVAARRRLVTAPAILLGLVASCLVPVLAGAAAAALFWLAARWQPALAAQELRDPVRRGCLVAFLLLGAGIGWLSCAAAARRAATLSLLMGMALPFGLLAVVTALRVPGASFLLLWPALAAAAVFVARAMFPSLSSRHLGVVLSHTLYPAVACLVFVPALWHLGLAFGLSAAPALAALAALAFLPAAACAGATEAGPPRLVGAALMAGALALLAGAVTAPPYDAATPQPDSLIYAIDDDAGSAYWLSLDDAPDRWTSRALTGATLAPRPEFFPRTPERRFLQAGAPAIPHRGPQVAILSDESDGASRRLHLHLSPGPGTEMVELLAPPGAHVLAGSIDGRSFGPASGGWLDLAYAGPQAEGLDLTLTSRGGPVALTIVDQSRGLPDAPGVALGPRPAGLMPAVAGSPLRASDMTLIVGSFQL